MSRRAAQRPRIGSDAAVVSSLHPPVKGEQEFRFRFARSNQPDNPLMSATYQERA
jgi:hypothetical protein